MHYEATENLRWLQKIDKHKSWVVNVLYRISVKC